MGGKGEVMAGAAGMEKDNGGKRRALGRGLDSLLPKPPAAKEAKPEPLPADGRAFEIAVDRIERNPYQTRAHFDAKLLEELTESIRAIGVIQPVLVRALEGGRYQLVAGERRWIASQRAGRATIPAVVAALSDTQAMEATIVENLQRADLNPMEQARAFDRLGREFHLTQEQMAVRTGKDRATISNFLRLLRLPPDLQGAVEIGNLTFGHARALLALEGPEQMMRAAQKVTALSMSVRQTESFIKGILHPETRGGAAALNVTKEAAAYAAKDPNVREMEATLRNALGLKVAIEDKNGRGRVIIEYANLEGFDALTERLLGEAVES